MCNRKARAQHRPIAAVKAKEREWRIIVQRSHDAGPDIVSNPFHPKMLALKIEVGDLLKRIHGPQPRIELDTVYDLNSVPEPDVFRPQVPVPIDNTALLQTVKQQKLPLPKEPPQQPVVTANCRLRKVEARIKQYSAVLLKIVSPLLEIVPWPV